MKQHVEALQVEAGTLFSLQRSLVRHILQTILCVRPFERTTNQGFATTPCYARAAHVRITARAAAPQARDDCTSGLLKSGMGPLIATGQYSRTGCKPYTVGLTT